ncbi:MAG: T9SS type A sorting domain-containing protein [Candidatus Stygibacter frigidus]|nr:T9SS type A sorting domain-containing protein [Candidatus Stygibacter frigidus]
MKNIVIIVLVFFFFVHIFGRSTINVPDEYVSIQDAIEISQDGDIILVQPGEYFENIDYQGKSITISSLFLTTNDESYSESTIINGNGEGSVVTFQNGESSMSVLSGFTIKNGDSIQGGGIYCTNDSNPYLFKLIITENIADNGGGIYLDNSSPNIEELIISENRAEGFGGGVLCGNSSSPIIERTIIDSNYASLGGGGISCGDNCDISLLNTTIIDNDTSDDGDGSGIYCRYTPTIELINSIVWSNSSDQIYFYNHVTSVTMIIAYSDIEGGQNSIITNGNGTVNWLAGNIDMDPEFVNADEDDYQLTLDSPCIDSGIDYLLYDNMVLINYDEECYYGSLPEIGACESEYISNDIVMNLYVDMGMAEFDTLSVCGNIAPLNWDFTNNDNMLEIYQDSIWLIQITFEEGCSRFLEFRFAVDTLDTENLPNGNHICILNESEAIQDRWCEYGVGGEVTSEDETSIPNLNDLFIRNYPNPFNPQTSISYSFPPLEKGTISIYNIKGQLVNQWLNLKGSGNIIWDGKNRSGNLSSSGIYFGLIRSKDQSKTLKMTLIK